MQGFDDLFVVWLNTILNKQRVFLRPYAIMVKMKSSPRWHFNSLIPAEKNGCVSRPISYRYVSNSF